MPFLYNKNCPVAYETSYRQNKEIRIYGSRLRAQCIDPEKNTLTSDQTENESPAAVFVGTHVIRQLIQIADKLTGC